MELGNGKNGRRRTLSKEKKPENPKKKLTFFFFFQNSKNLRYNADGAFAASVLLCLMALGTLYVKDKLERKAVE